MNSNISRHWQPGFVRDPESGWWVRQVSGGVGTDSWVTARITSQVDSTALTNTVTATSILPPSAIDTLPNNWCYVGRQLEIDLWGRISTVVTTPGTLTLDVRFGNVIVFNGGAMALNIVAKVNVSFRLQAFLTCRAIGSGTAALMIGQGKFVSEAVIGSPLPSAGGSGALLLPASAPAVGAGFDSTAVQTVNVFGTWSIANAANSILTHQYTLRQL